METDQSPILAPTSEEKTHAMLCWLLAIFIGFISPIIFMIMDKDKPFVYRNAMQALTFQIGIFVLYMIAMVLVVVLIGALLIPVVGILHVVFAILGTINANNGIVYEPPVTGPLAKKWFNV
jgi:uncharacterized membrane protein